MHSKISGEVSKMQGLALIFVTLLLLCQSGAIDLLDYHKKDFEKTFHDQCDKYPFVQQYVSRLEHTDERYLTFVYQANGFKNGGLGDKIGGLISAVAMALRFNRTLLLRSENDMHEVFRPYHPTDIHSKTPKYSWFNFTSWSNYDWKYANTDATEYDLYDCINNTGQKNGHCSMKDGDASTPHILYRSNRAYLCYYDRNRDSLAFEEMKAIGVNETTNLYEAAGCMMRLALWPTEMLWEEVGKQLREFQSSFPSSAGLRRQRRLRTRRIDEVDRRTTKGSPKVVQVGLHFRCGDKSYIKKGGYDHMCVYDEDDTPENKKSMFPLGNPYEMGICAHRSLHSYLTTALMNSGRGTTKSTSLSSQMNMSDFDTQSASSVDLQSLVHGDTLAMGFVASDNEMASMQMNMTLGLPHSIVSPQGCHVELDMSKQCHMFTVSQWLLLSLSDILVTQESIPSSFSRYAGIYGLKPDPFRNGKDCGMSESTMELSRKPISNWFC